MDEIAKEVAIGLIATVFGGFLSKFIPWLYLYWTGIFSPDIAKLPPKVQANYNEPNKEGNIGPVSERIEVTQRGRLVSGRIISNEQPNYEFVLRGRVYRDVIVGQFFPKGRHAHPAAMGAFQLKAAKGDSIWSGHCIWYDLDTERVETSTYSWTIVD